ncbi:MAG TPA: Lrp/AsnC family transcriptional regulator [Candidatus Bathyarchaeota archaeon]|nr:Lrp/AsnC family transcriptional regulator [Candidatus Bathyarchaeota archaeon]
MIDEVSLKVLEEFVRDSRQSIREVARKLGVSSGTVASRLKEMEAQGIIKGYTTLLDYEKLGYVLTAVTEVIVSGGMIKEVGEEIARLSQAIAVYNITGDADILVVGKFDSRQSLSNFIERVLKLPNVVRTKTSVVLSTLKEGSNHLVRAPTR